MLAILVIVVIETRSTITVLGLIFGLLTSLIISFLGNKKGRIRINYRFIFASSVLLIAIIIIFMNINHIGHLIIEQTAGSNNALYRRLYEVGIELAYLGHEDGGSNYLWSRLSRLSDSFELFISSPFIGNGYKYGYDFFSSKLLGIGNHSEWLDIMAVYGLIGGLPFLLIYYFAVKETQKYNNRTTMKTYVFAVIFLGLFNPMKSFQTHLIIFFVIPSSYILFKKSHDKEV